jgi:hypothetical protein
MLQDSGFGGTTAFLVRNGSSYVRIDGACNYWVLQGRDRAPIKQGTLNASEAKQLSGDVRFTEWSRWDSVVVESDFQDIPAQTLLGDGNEFVCFGLCEAPRSPEDQTVASELRPIFQNAESWLERLNGQGTPVTGPVRVVGWTSTLAGDQWVPEAISQWQASIDLDEFVFDAPNDPPATGILVEGADADYFRDLRVQAETRFTSGLGTFSGMIGIDDGDRIVELLVSDVLPQENSEGIVPR